MMATTKADEAVVRTVRDLAENANRQLRSWQLATLLVGGAGIYDTIKRVAETTDWEKGTGEEALASVSRARAEEE